MSPSCGRDVGNRVHTKSGIIEFLAGTGAVSAKITKKAPTEGMKHAD